MALGHHPGAVVNAPATDVQVGARFGYAPAEQALRDRASGIGRAYRPLDGTPLSAAALKELFTELRQLGYLGSLLPRARGGHGLTPMDFAALIDGLGPDLPLIGNHSVQRYLNSFGTETQIAEALPPLLSGEGIGGIAITEPGVGSNLAAITTTARRDGDDYILDGSKTWVTHGMVAMVFILLARVGDGTDGGTLARFILPGDAPGLVREAMRPVGLGHLTFANLRLEGCRLPSSARLGEEGSGAAGAKSAFPIARALAALQAVGIAEAALAMAAEFARGHQIAKGRLADSAVVQTGYADLSAQCAAARLLALAVMNDLSHPDAMRSASEAKAFGCRLAVEATQWAAGVLGSRALETGHPVRRLLADAQMMAVVDGTPVLNQMVAARRTIAARDG